MRLLKVRMLDNALKSIMVDDSQVVGSLMVLICTKIGITNHDEYSLVWDKPEVDQENIQKNTNKYGTLGGTMTLKKKKIVEGEKEIDPKMEELKRQLCTEDGGKDLHNELKCGGKSHFCGIMHYWPQRLKWTIFRVKKFQ